MKLTHRALSTLAILAVTASLAVVPGLAQTATATDAPVAPARTSVTAECAAAQAALSAARTSKAKAHRAVVKARKALRKATKTHRPVKVRKAKRVLKKARHRYQVRTHRVRVQTARVGYACSSPRSAARATGTGMKLDLLASASGLVTQVIDLTQLNALLDRLLPGVGDQLDAGQLTALLTGFNSGALSLDEATALLGGFFSPEEIEALLGGTASPELVLELAEHIIGQLSGLAGGFPVPGSFDPTGLLETFAGIFGSLDPAQLGGLVDLLLSAVGESGTSLDPAELTDLLDALIPGLSSALDPAELTSMLDAVNAGSLDPATLTNLLGGQFTAAELGDVQGGTASADLVGEVLANVVAQLGTLGGDDLELPGMLDPTVLQDLVDTVTGLVADLLGGLLVGDEGGLVCTLLPILC